MVVAGCGGVGAGAAGVGCAGSDYAAGIVSRGGGGSEFVCGGGVDCGCCSGAGGEPGAHYGNDFPGRDEVGLHSVMAEKCVAVCG